MFVAMCDYNGICGQSDEKKLFIFWFEYDTGVMGKQTSCDICVSVWRLHSCQIRASEVTFILEKYMKNKWVCTIDTSVRLQTLQFS